MIVAQALVAYVLLTFEAQTRLHRISILSFFASTIWFFFGRGHNPEVAEVEIMHATFNAVEIGMFILYALSLVAVLGFAGLFDVLQQVIYRGDMTDQKLFNRMGWVCFFGSALVDNVTITIVLVTISTVVFLTVTEEITATYVTACLGFVLYANAGGVFSFLGDVTSIMVVESGKIAPDQLFYMTFPSAITSAYVGSKFFARKLSNSPRHVRPTQAYHPTFTDYLVMAIGILTLVTLPLLFKYAAHMPPFLGLMGAYGVTSGLYHFLNEGRRRRIEKLRTSGQVHSLELPQLEEQAQTLLSRTLEKSIERVELATFLVIVPIILIVEGVRTTGAFNDLSRLVFGDNPSTTRIIIAILILGLLSMFIDNVPLTAVAIIIMPTSDPWMWGLLAFSVAMGGPIMLLGSLPGIIILGKLGEKMTYLRYIREASLGNSAAFASGFAVYLLWMSMIRFLL